MFLLIMIWLFLPFSCFSLSWLHPFGCMSTMSIRQKMHWLSELKRERERIFYSRWSSDDHLIKKSHPLPWSVLLWLFWFSMLSFLCWPYPPFYFLPFTPSFHWASRHSLSNIGMMIMRMMLIPFLTIFLEEREKYCFWTEMEIDSDGDADNHEEGWDKIQ